MIENRPEIIARIMTPFIPEKRRHGPTIVNHLGDPVTASYGMHEDGYDIRVARPLTLVAGYTCYGLALEHMRMPLNLRAKCEDKSTSLRLGFRVSGRAAPGWHGRLTLEFYYSPPLHEVDGRLIIGPPQLVLPAEWPVVTLEFTQLAQDGDYGPDGKYQGAMDVQIAR